MHIVFVLRRLPTGLMDQNTAALTLAIISIVFAVLSGGVAIIVAVAVVYSYRRDKEKLAGVETQFIALLGKHEDHYAQQVGRMNAVFLEYDKQIVDEMEQIHKELEDFHRQLPPSSQRARPNVVDMRKRSEDRVANEMKSQEEKAVYRGQKRSA